MTNDPMRNFVFLLVVLFALAFTGCRDDSVEVLGGHPVLTDSVVSFSADLLPLVEAYCTISGCHDGSNSLAPSLNGYETIRPIADSVISQVETRRMPIGVSLSEQEISVFTNWLSQGALNN